MSEILEFSPEEKEEVLKNFMLEFFDFDGMKDIGMFEESMRDDYQAQADIICKFFGYDTVYEYAAVECNCHLTVSEESRKNEKNFVTVIVNEFK